MGYQGSRFANKVAKEYAATDLGISATITVSAGNDEFEFPFIPLTEYTKMQWIMEVQLDPAGSGAPSSALFLPNRAKDSNGGLIEGKITVVPFSTPFYNTFTTGVGSIDTVNRLLVASYVLKANSFNGSTPGFYAEYSVEGVSVTGSSPFPMIQAASMNLGFLNLSPGRDLLVNNPRVILFD